MTLTNNIAAGHWRRPAQELLRVPFGVTLPVSRHAYIAWAVVLYAGRYATEFALASSLVGVRLDVATFLTPHFLRVEPRLSEIWWQLVVANLPFLWVAVTMSVRRAADAGIPESLGFLVLVPGIHYLIGIALALAPTSAPIASTSAGGPFRSPAESQSLRRESSAHPRFLLNATLFGLAVLGIGIPLLGKGLGWKAVLGLGPLVAATTTADRYRVLTATLRAGPAASRQSEAAAEYRTDGKSVAVNVLLGCGAGLLAAFLVLLIVGWAIDPVASYAGILIVFGLTPVILLANLGYGLWRGLDRGRLWRSYRYVAGLWLTFGLVTGGARYFELTGFDKVVWTGAVALLMVVLGLVVGAAGQPWGADNGSSEDHR